MANSAPGFAKHPNHTIEYSDINYKILVSIDKAAIGSTTSAILLKEANYPAAYYLPMDTLDSKYLRPSEHTTYCPFKGTAGYFHLVHNGKIFENAVWVYREPYDEAHKIKDLISIYSNVAAIIPME